MKEFCSSLRKDATKIILKRKKMLPLTKEELNVHQDARNCYICVKRILNPLRLVKNKNNRKVRYHCNYTGIYRDTAHIICNLKFNVPNDVPVVFDNGSNYDYHFYKRFSKQI